MGRGYLHVRRFEDIVVVVQDGYFDNALMERMFELVDLATAEANAAHGSCAHVADTRTYAGASIAARFRCEQWLARLTPSVRRVAVIAPPSGFTRRILEISTMFFPRLPFRFVTTEDEAIRLVQREDLSEQVRAALAEAPRLGQDETRDEA